MKDFHVSIFFLINLTTKFLILVLIHLLRKNEEDSSFKKTMKTYTYYIHLNFHIW